MSDGSGGFAPDLLSLQPMELRVHARAAPGLELRPVHRSDREALAALYLAAYPPEIGAADEAEALAEIDSTFSGEYGVLLNEACLLGILDGRPAGAVLTTERSIWDEGLDGPFIIDLFVHPEARGRGLGGALVAGVVERCRAAGAHRLSLRIGEGTSPAASAIYESLGFVPPSAP